MTEQEQVAAIDALAAMILKERRGLQWDHVLEQDKEGLRHSAIDILRKMHEMGALEGYEIYTRILGKHWLGATSEEAAICMNAARAMKEVIEVEANQ